ncbi:uncharacterized protein LOC114239677 [Bombyx mandarina]|uniref:Uncharacterized protein LOC114239677 n=1 Tax=Bombyx mandarina TaxID=7092 RepID=A0A6J2J8L7_BOMMA|nr:uncharacterized protein LOC114239677 [Bombyx mandarina]
MTLNTLLLTFLSAIFIAKYECKSYCGADICNNSKQHTLCKFQSEAPADHCIQLEKTIKNAEDVKAILDKINSRRNKVAAGEIRSLPPASNMLKLEWNDELQKSAQRWANQCVKHRAPDIKDVCRDLGSVSVGQNIATIHGDAPGLTPLSLVDVWYMELLHVNVSILGKFTPSSETGHSHYNYFTQLVWADSRQVGCGAVTFKERYEDSGGQKNRTIYRLVCNFAPGGNSKDKPVYLSGMPCSRCPKGQLCDPDYRALCGLNRNQALHFNNATSSTKRIVSGPSAALSRDIDHNKPEYTMNFNPNISEDNYKIKSQKPVTYIPDIEDELNIPFNYFSHLRNFTRQAVSEITTNSNTCKESLAVDDFIELLKKKLSEDPMFKEILTTRSPYNDGYTDQSVVAFVSKIYSKKMLTTTSKSTEQDLVNSTLLTDLVKAVIFRGSSNSHVTEEVTESTYSVNGINPIKIQAELSEIKPNTEFTGHFFYPEDVDNGDEIENSTELYYDTTNLAVSDIVQEIEEIRKSTTVKDFLGEILDSDEVTEDANAFGVIMANETPTEHKVLKKFIDVTN